MSDYPEPTTFNGDDDRELECSDDAETCECPECRKWRDNREGPEPDGEALRGGESAAWHREHQFTVLRKLK